METMVKMVRVYAGDDGESHLEEVQIQYPEGARRTPSEQASGFSFANRIAGTFTDFHNGPTRQYVLYLTTSVEIGVGDGTKAEMSPGDVLLAEDSTGRGHTSRVLKTGVCAFVRIED